MSASHPSEAEGETVYLCDRCNTGGSLAWVEEHARTTGHTYGKAVLQPLTPPPDADRETIAQTLWIGFGLHVEKLGFHNDPESALRAASLIAQYASLLPPETT